MDERLKRFLHMAVGLASTSDKARRLLDQMQIEGQLSEDEGKRILNELFHSGAEAGSEMKDEIKAYFDNLLLELQLPSRKEVEDLHQRIAALENEIQQLRRS